MSRSLLSFGLEVLAKGLGASLLFGILFILLLPQYLLTVGALRKSWDAALDPQTRVVPRSRWWFFGTALRRYIWNRNLLIITAGYFVGGCWLTLVTYRDALRGGGHLAPLFILIYILLLSSLLFAALTAFGALLPWLRNHIARVIVGAFVSCLFLGTCFTICWALIAILPVLDYWAEQLPPRGFWPLIGTLFPPIATCALLWRRWIRQGDAWFRIREQ